MSVLLLKVFSIQFALLVFCRVFSVAWGRTSCVPRPRKRFRCVPRCLLHEHQLRSDLSTRRLRKCISCFPRALVHVCHTDTRANLTNRRGSEPAVQRDTHTHTPHNTHRHTHTPHTHAAHTKTHHTTHTHTTYTHTTHTHTHTPHTHTTHTHVPTPHTYTHRSNNAV